MGQRKLETHGNILRGRGRETSAFEMVLSPLPRVKGGCKEIACSVGDFRIFLAATAAPRRAFPPPTPPPLGVFVSGAKPPTPPCQSRAAGIDKSKFENFFK